MLLYRSYLPRPRCRHLHRQGVAHIIFDDAAAKIFFDDDAAAAATATHIIFDDAAAKILFDDDAAVAGYARAPPQSTQLRRQGKLNLKHDSSMRHRGQTGIKEQSRNYLLLSRPKPGRSPNGISSIRLEVMFERRITYS